MELYTTGTGQRITVHDGSSCYGGACPIHYPSQHHMRDWPTHWRGDRHIMERICPHGIGHPDPDCMYAMADNVHGCDGCCHPPEIENARLVEKIIQLEQQGKV